MQLYLPPDYMLNKDFLKAVLMDKKSLLRLDQVKYVNVPFYDELSVVKIWPMVQKDPEIMKYFPAKLPKGRVPDRSYFFNIMNTFQPGYLEHVIRNANNQRNSVANEEKAMEAIEVTEDWWNALTAMPFSSRKWPIVYIAAGTAGGTMFTILFFVQKAKAELFTCSSRAPSPCRKGESGRR